MKPRVQSESEHTLRCTHSPCTTVCHVATFATFQAVEITKDFLSLFGEAFMFFLGGVGLVVTQVLPSTR